MECDFPRLEPRFFVWVGCKFPQNKFNLEKLRLLGKLLEAGEEESWKDKAPALTERLGNEP